ncbi:hypothetical protein [Pseudothauera rhizosphaerae]|uniref:Fimbrial assembly protein (PilN) n=1 Tax=Pseudothauera rhizosphaerae TaxID=2565932 RepID=A0A4S4A7R8_9RHOO|nr:hypothetical protein [Pseudothauera rhizosphaerae]THF54775.1 hypothetical protein E6O51_21385 [Pseudothauera rhizosphaerae]
MRRVVIDFSPLPRRGYRLDAALLMLGIAAVGLTGWCYVLLDERNEALTDRAGALRRQIERTRLVWAEAGGAPNAARPSSVQARTSQDWSSLVQRIERSVHDEVTFLSLQVGTKGSAIEILAEAKNSTAMFAFMGRLAHEGGFGPVALRHQEVASDHPYKPVRFSLTVGFDYDDE